MQPHFLQDVGAAAAERRVTRGGFQTPPPADAMDSFHLPPLIEEALDSSGQSTAPLSLVGVTGRGGAYSLLHLPSR